MKNKNNSHNVQTLEKGIELPTLGTTFTLPRHKTIKRKELTYMQERHLECCDVSFRNSHYENNEEYKGLVKNTKLPEKAFAWHRKPVSGIGMHLGNASILYPTGMKIMSMKDGDPKFRWKYGYAAAPWRYDWINVETHNILLVENEYKALVQISKGVEDDRTWIVLARTGKDFPDVWGSMFSGYRVFVVYDPAGGGKIAAMKIGEIVRQFANYIQVVSERKFNHMSV